MLKSSDDIVIEDITEESKQEVHDLDKEIYIVHS